LKTKWMSLVATCAILMAVFVASTPPNPVKAQDGEVHMMYMPLAYKPQKIWFDDFNDEDPVWDHVFKLEGVDGWFEHLDGVLAGHIRDNAGMVVVSPGWYARGDFTLEVDGRFMSKYTVDCPNPDKDCLKSGNGWGLVFGGNEEWNDFYALMVGDGGAQHFWALVHFRVVDVDGRTRVRTSYLTNDGYRGAPNFMRGWDSWNRVMIVREGTTISLYCWDKGDKVYKLLTNGIIEDATFGDGQIGLMFTSYEFREGEVQFENLLLYVPNAH
jgi:hypothetical protein